MSLEGEVLEFLHVIGWCMSMSMSMNTGTVKLVAASYTFAQVTLICGCGQVFGFSGNLAHVCFSVHACMRKHLRGLGSFLKFCDLNKNPFQLLDKQRFSHSPGLLLSNSFQAIWWISGCSVPIW